MDAAIERTVHEFKDITDPVTGQPLLTKGALSQIEVMLADATQKSKDNVPDQADTNKEGWISLAADRTA